MILLTIFCWFSFYSGTIKFVFQGVVWSIIKCGMQTLFSRVYIDGKRVSNTLYGPCKMFSERHVSGIYTLTNSIHIANYGYGLECKLMREFSQTLFSVLPLPRPFQQSGPPMPSLSIFLWCNNLNEWCGHKLRPNHAHPLRLKFFLGRTLLFELLRQGYKFKLWQFS